VSNFKNIVLKFHQNGTADTRASLNDSIICNTRFEEDEYQDLPNETFTAWMYIYWSTFCLAWGILPLVRAVLLSGHFTALARLRAGCRKALRGYIFMSMVGHVFHTSIHVLYLCCVCRICHELYLLLGLYSHSVCIAFAGWIHGNNMGNVRFHLWR
jgi:hypothetical protein